MPNSGMIMNQTHKCDKCRKNFIDIWLPTTACCLISKSEEMKEHPRYSRYTPRATLYKRKNERADGLSMIADGSPKSAQWNKLAPFKTIGKPTCGFNFSRETDNKRKSVIMPSNLVKWRSEKFERTPMYNNMLNRKN